MIHALVCGMRILALLFLTASLLSSPAAEKPNIILINVDDLGWTDLACFGSEFYETPHLDQLAAEGMRFTDAYAAAPVCSPTRAAIMTGQTPGRLLNLLLRDSAIPYRTH